MKYTKIQQNARTVTIPKAFMQWVCCDLDLSKKEIKLFIYLTTLLNSTNYTVINLKKIAFNMSMDYKDANIVMHGATEEDAKKALDGLIDACVVLEGSDEYTEDGYKFLT